MRRGRPGAAIGPGGKSQLEFEPTIFEMWPVCFGGIADDLDQVASPEVVFLLASFHSGEVEHVIDEPSEARSFGGDDIEIRTLLGRIDDAAFGEQFGEHADRSQRSLEFVGNVADKIGFLPGRVQLPVEIA